MGKSPAKWIKTVLFGKKFSKSNHVKGKELKKFSSERGPAHEKAVDITPPLNPPPLNPSTVSSDGPHAVEINERKIESANNQCPVAQQDVVTPESQDQSVDLKPSVELNSTTEAERTKEENAATKAQAAFRGYLARRAFKALKGIIRLQALIRGHLVRRQAVSTLYSLIGIVKVQARARGVRVRYLHTGLDVQKVCNLVMPLHGKFRDPAGVDMTSRLTISSANTFVRNLIAPPTTRMPLRVQYDRTDPNSVFKWLDRWSSIHAWNPASQPKKVTSKHPKKQTVEAEITRPKHSVRRIRSSIDNSTSVHSSSESEKARRTVKKVSSHLPELAPENPQHELEKVKRNLRKVHSPVVVENSGQPEATVKKPGQNQGKLLESAKIDVSGPYEVNPPDKVKEEAQALDLKESVPDTVVISQPVEAVEKNVQPLKVSETIEVKTVEISNDDQNTLVESDPLGKSNEENENAPVSNGELKSKDNVSTPSEIQKSSSRRASFPAKQDLVEDVTPQNNTSKLPSYMAATESAKAKLRGQNSSPRFSQDGNGKSNVTRRHSLPSSTNGKVTSSSPRTQRPVHGSRKAGCRGDKSLLSSRDGKLVQAEWRR